MKPVSKMHQNEIGAYVTTHLHNSGIKVVLSGGAVVSIYSNRKYVSKDLDLVDMYSSKREKIQKAMREIGFVEKARYFVHPDSEYVVEFPPGPLTVGLESVKEIVELKLSTGTLRIISATDCVKDRLAAYFHWNDRQCLEQAILVSQMQNVDMEEVKRWSKKEGKLHEFNGFISLLADRKTTKSSPP